MEDGRISEDESDVQLLRIYPVSGVTYDCALMYQATRGSFKIDELSNKQLTRYILEEYI